MTNIDTQERGIFLDIAVYEKILDTLEMLKSIKVDAHHNKETELPLYLEDLLDQAMLEKERMTLIYQNKLFMAVVPIEEEDLIEQLENCIDAKAIKEALDEAKEKGTISAEQVNQQLGW